jgi:ribonuclease E
MANKMLIDATHPEETRVVVLRGNRVEEFDFESATRRQLRGNIYLAKVTRVEPSLQAAFVDYGGNRHGFLAFSEIHPDYYQIPVADRQALIDEDERAQRAADDEIDRRSRRRRHQPPHPAARRDEAVRSEFTEPAETQAEDAGQATEFQAGDGQAHDEPAPGEGDFHAAASAESTEDPPAGIEPPEPSVGLVLMPGDAALGDPEPVEPHDESPEETTPVATVTDGSESGDSESVEIAGAATAENAEAKPADPDSEENGESDEAAEEVVESVGGSDALEEVSERAPRYRRQYKIQEVIKRRQVMLVQVVKEERGSKGAALTTYLSLAGRYSVLMPNTARGGGISRKITSSEDRARLKEIAEELEVPEGMGVILRTAGASRTKIEVKRDFEYLLRMWETVRDLTLKSTAPKLVYEEGSLVKRSIRDLYSKDIDEVMVAGTDAYYEAKEFMRMLMPSHAKNVKLYADTQPLLSRYGVESQLDAMFSPTVQLRSGGYIVLNQAEALVAIDVNSGRATREHHIEDTALKTNLEAADEIARQLRLRDLAGLIVIDFIDMEENRNNRAVERRLKECLKHDRARIQVGRISHFGLLEMSRQRIRTSVLESSTEKCPYCGGSGHLRSVSSLALQVLRALEEQLMKGATHNLIARTRPDVALYVLNQKRAHLRGLEERFAITITISSDESVTAPLAFVIDRGEQVHTIEAAKALAERTPAIAAPLEEEDELEDFDAAAEADDEAETAVSTASSVEPEASEGEVPGGPRRRRRRRGRRGGRNGGDSVQAPQPRDHETVAEPAGEFDPDAAAPAYVEMTEEQAETAPQDRGERTEAQRDGERRRRRGRRGGRRNRLRNGDAALHGTDDRGPLPPQEDFAPAHDFAPAREQGSEPAREFTKELTAPPATEPELKAAVADLDASPPTPTHAPVSVEASPPSAPPVEPEPPRRRSTVRERAPIGGSDAPLPPIQPAAPVPEPVVTELTEAADTDRPRKTGWWSRRFAGG